MEHWKANNTTLKNSEEFKYLDKIHSMVKKSKAIHEKMESIYNTEYGKIKREENMETFYKFKKLEKEINSILHMMEKL